MSGTVLQITPKRNFNFTGVSSGSSQEIVLAQGIDVSQWSEASLMVRAHSKTFGANVGKIEVYAYLDGRTAEEPGILFASTTPIGTVTIDNSTTTPTYSVKDLGSSVGSMIKVAAKGTRTADGNNIEADISIDLSLKMS